MDEARITELLEPFLSDVGDSRRTPTLSPVQLRFISMYVDLLLRWNDRVNLTAIREPEEIVTRHFGESIFAARQLFPQPGAGAGTMPHVIDIGSGAGFPGLPIKIWAPQIHLTLMESNQKKSTFLREVVRHLRLADVDIFAGRAETYLGIKGDVVTFRAVERFDSVIRIAGSLVGPQGRLAVMLGRSQLEQIRVLPGLQWNEPVGIPLSASRAVIIGRNESA
ncbi:MAG: 16S rRNA (guanine(527)-N(7))-methyltransferase RsmG [Terriglobales bacterium]